MRKIINILLFILIISFLFFTLRFYVSNKNIKDKSFNRVNIDQILKEKIKDLPVIENDTNSVIEFNNSLEKETSNEKKRSFWDLLKTKWNLRP